VCDAHECVGKNPTDRAKQGVKRSLLVEGGGGPLGIVIAGANVPDAQLLKATLEAVVVERPKPTIGAPQHLCLDKGYDNAPAEAVVTEAGYVPHIRRIGEEKLDERREKTCPARRWVVERTFAWLSRWRGILIRWEKKADNYLATLKLACALIWFRKCHTLA
jgi:putative transposase